MLRWIKLRPLGGDGREDCRSIHAAREARARGILCREAEDEAHKRGDGVELRVFGDAERLNLPPDAFQYPQNRVLPGVNGESPSYPGGGVDRIEHPQGEGANRVPRLRTWRHFS